MTFHLLFLKKTSIRSCCAAAVTALAVTGVAVAGDDASLCKDIKELISYAPSHFRQLTPVRESGTFRPLGVFKECDILFDDILFETKSDVSEPPMMLCTLWGEVGPKTHNSITYTEAQWGEMIREAAVASDTIEKCLGPTKKPKGTRDGPYEGYSTRMSWHWNMPEAEVRFDVTIPDSSKLIPGWSVRRFSSFRGVLKIFPRIRGSRCSTTWDL